MYATSDDALSNSGSVPETKQTPHDARDAKSAAGIYVSNSRWQERRGVGATLIRMTRTG
jgi:hypothetical protein